MLPKDFIVDTNIKDTLNILHKTFNRLTFKSVEGYCKEGQRK